MPSPEERIGVTAGHVTDANARTGCTVVLFDRPAMTVVDVRGGAPGTRETDLLAPGRLVRRADAILLTGGSAFGLAAADGVMRFLAERGRGVTTRIKPVPIVPTAVVYDLAVGDPVAPDARSGYEACVAAEPLDNLTHGQVGAGTGATTGKMGGYARPERGGVGIATWTWSRGSVTAIVVVNAFGRVMHDPGTGARLDVDPRLRLFDQELPERDGRESTTLAIVLVDAPVDYSSLVLCTIAAHDAYARSIRPCHTIFDGDVAFAVALRDAPSIPASDTLRITTATELAVERAILDAVTA